MKKRIKLYTHTDLGGYGCSILLKIFLSANYDIEVTYLDYSDIKNTDFKKDIEKYEFTENIDFVAVTQKKVTAQGNSTEYKEYFLKIDENVKKINAENLSAELSQLQNESKQNVRVTADKNLEYGIIIDLMSKLKNSGIKNINLNMQTGA